MWLSRLLLVSFLFLDACVDPFPLDLSSSGLRMVVDGMITNEPGPYKVSIVYSTRLQGSLRLPTPVSGAEVMIGSSLFETEFLHEPSPGVYETSGLIRGQVGVAYYLTIRIGKREYRTDPQTLRPAGRIDSLYIKFAPEAVVNPDAPPDSDGPEYIDAFKLFIDSRGIEGEQNHYRWRWIGINKFKTFPELHTIGETPNTIPAPWPCSGYVRYLGELLKVRECECCICWSTHYSSTATVSDARFVNDHLFKGVEVGSVAITPKNFYEKYYVEVEQLSVSKEVHTFWKLVEAQQKNLGSWFQPNATRIKGNIINIKNPEDEVFGIFSVSGVTRRRIFITPEQIPYKVQPIEVITYDCRDFQNSTTQEPGIW